jgi:hypothetical protein
MLKGKWFNRPWLLLKVVLRALPGKPTGLASMIVLFQSKMCDRNHTEVTLQNPLDSNPFSNPTILSALKDTLKLHMSLRKTVTAQVARESITFGTVKKG